MDNIKQRLYVLYTKGAHIGSVFLMGEALAQLQRLPSNGNQAPLEASALAQAYTEAVRLGRVDAMEMLYARFSQAP